MTSVGLDLSRLHPKTPGQLQVFLMKGVYMTQSMLFLVLAVLYAGYPSAVISV